MIIGYLFSMVMGFVLGQKTESRLFSVSEYHFPAYQQTQRALYSFNEQIKYYKDAVTFNDESLMDPAGIKSFWVKLSLENILEAQALDPRIINAIQETLTLHKDFTSSAETLYAQILSQGMQEAFIEKAENLSIQADELQTTLEMLTSMLSEGLKTELADVRDVSQRQRHFNMFLFLGVVVSAMTLIWLIISRSVIRPLRKTLMLEKAVEQSIDGIAMADLDGYITFINQAWKQMHGYEMDELIGEKLDIFHTQEQLANEVLPFNEVVMKNGFNTGEMGHKRKNETSFPTAMTVTLLNDEKGRSTGMVATARDITMQKHNEAELKKAKVEAELANQAKGEFLANMSHEIRTPLNGVMGVFNLLLSTEMDSEQLDLVDTGKKSADSLLTVINDILDFSKIDAGRLDLETIDFNFRNTIEEVVELPAMMAHEKQLEFIYEIQTEIPSLLRGDPGRLRQIIINLTNNAMKFTKNGEIVLRIVLVRKTNNHVKIRFEIKDTGIGIPENKLETIFESFKQSDSSTTRRYGGTGLGLTISKMLAELMTGEIGVESEMGKGSTFWFTAVFEKQPHSEERPLVPSPDLHGKRFLLVDDNKTNLGILHGYLESWGCYCDSAHSGEMALSLIKAVVKVNAPYDMIITDMRMPGMDGAELGERIKNDPQLKDMILVMLTSQGLRGDASRMEKIGFSAYLTKPIRRSQFYDCITGLFGKKQRKTIEKPSQIVTKYTISDDRIKGKRILIVEDNMVNQKLAQRMIKNFGFQADVANNGKEALKVLKSLKYDVVLMDIQMPEMDGLEATKRIRDSQSNVMDNKIPIVAMTAHAMKRDREKCIAVGMNDYLSKPIKPDELLETIKKQIFLKGEAAI